MCLPVKLISRLPISAIILYGGSRNIVFWPRKFSLSKWSLSLGPSDKKSLGPSPVPLPPLPSCPPLQWGGGITPRFSLNSTFQQVSFGARNYHGFWSRVCTRKTWKCSEFLKLPNIALKITNSKCIPITLSVEKFWIKSVSVDLATYESDLNQWGSLCAKSYTYN